jgi:hypothetical protein
MRLKFFDPRPVVRLVTRREAEPLLGYAAGSLKAVMQQQPDRWPAPVACRLGGARALQWRLDELQAIARGEGALRSQRPDGADEDGLVTCLSCGNRYRSLGPHLARAHRISAAQYRAEHGLPASAALMARAVRATLSARRQAAMDEQPELVENMKAAAPPPDTLARRSAQARARTDSLPAVRAARRDGALRTLPAARQARRDALEARAAAAGFASLADAVAATRSLTVAAAANRIGVSTSTVKRWRGKPDSPEERVADR